MKFIIKKGQLNLLSMMRRAGYSPSSRNDSFIRRAGSGAFPRFHVYIDDNNDSWQLKIHLDQKGACYTGHTAHSGDYDGDVLQAEQERIMNLLK